MKCVLLLVCIDDFLIEVYNTVTQDHIRVPRTDHPSNKLSWVATSSVASTVQCTVTFSLAVYIFYSGDLDPVERIPHRL